MTEREGTTVTTPEGSSSTGTTGTRFDPADQAARPDPQSAQSVPQSDPQSDPPEGSTEGSTGAGTPTHLAVEGATAFAIDGFDPADPWNAVLSVEGETTLTALPLTPTTLDYLTAQLGQVRAAQREALGVRPDDASEDDGEPERGRRWERLGHAARVATGSESVSRVWRGSRRGQLTIVVAVLVFVALGVLLSVLT